MTIQFIEIEFELETLKNDVEILSLFILESDEMFAWSLKCGEMYSYWLFQFIISNRIFERIWVINCDLVKFK